MSKPKAKADHRWHPADIKAEVEKRGSNLSKLARENGKEESVCRQALRRPLPAGEQIISAFLKVPLHELWPERYAPNGRRYVTRHVRVENSHERAPAHRQIVGAR